MAAVFFLWRFLFRRSNALRSIWRRIVDFLTRAARLLAIAWCHPNLLQLQNKLRWHRHFQLRNALNDQKSPFDVYFSRWHSYWQDGGCYDRTLIVFFKSFTRLAASTSTRHYNDIWRPHVEVKTVEVIAVKVTAVVLTVQVAFK